jgi:hypothetical protein
MTDAFRGLYRTIDGASPADFSACRVPGRLPRVLTRRRASYAAAAIALRIFAMRRNAVSASALDRVAPAG